MNRNLTIITSVLALHIAALWVLQAGLLHRMVELVVPAEVLMRANNTSSPDKPQAQSVVKPVKKVPVAPELTAQAATKTVAPTAPAVALAVAQTESTPTATASTPAPAATGPAPPTHSDAVAAVGTAPAAPKIELPSSDADYLNNPKPRYPLVSKRLNEQGKVVVRVWIGTDGLASQPSIQTSSGFDRLDHAALNTVVQWRYVPGKRNGAAVAMWFDVPVRWVLN